MLAALRVLVSEKDLLAELSYISIISRLAVAIASLQFAQSALEVYVDSRL
jgi:hypothetical protein